MGESETRSFGEYLREARERAGLAPEALAGTTRIQRRYLEALEAEDWDALPGGVIGRGFVRVVAREVGLDPKEALERYREARGEGEDGRPNHSLPEAEWKVHLRGERSGPPLLLVFLLLAGTALGVWIWSPWSVERSLEVAEPSTPVETRPSVAAVEPSPAEAEAPGEPLEEESEEYAPPADAPADSAEQPDAVSEPAPEPAVVAEVLQEPTAHRLEVQAVEKVWLRVQPDGGRASESILGPGDSRTYEADENIVLKLGNAGGVRLWWDGEALRVPGGPGQVVNLTFPEALRTLRP